MINETTEGQEAGEQREELFFKVIKAGNKILEILAALFIILMLLYGAYSLWDTCQINRRAFISGELMKYKPAGKMDESPSLQEHQKINPDVSSWLTVDGTKIDYQIVLGETNLEYINQDIYGEFALSGSIFLDSRNDRKFIDSYSLLYGHHMDNGAMFGDVMNYKEKEYFESHKTGTLYLNEQLEKIQWFACVETDAYDEVIYNPQDYKKENLEEFLGRARYTFQKKNEEDQIGIVRGLAWTSVGGDTLQIEVNLMPGQGEFVLTGQMGDVMKESAQIGISYIRSIAENYQIDAEFFKNNDIHIHIPEGAVPKDGPSAGITMATAMLSAITKIPVKANLAMTGEITLRGRVLPIGGLKEKLLAAKNAGITTVLVPKENKPDVEELEKEITDGLNIIFVSSMEEVIKEAFTGGQV